MMRFFRHKGPTTIAISDNWNIGTDLTNTRSIEVFFEDLFKEAETLDDHIHDFELACVKMDDTKKQYKVLLTEENPLGDVFRLQIPRKVDQQKTFESNPLISTEDILQLSRMSADLNANQFPIFSFIREQLQEKINAFDNIKLQAVKNLNRAQFERMQRWFDEDRIVQGVIKKMRRKISTMNAKLQYRSEQLDTLLLRVNNIAYELTRASPEAQQTFTSCYTQLFKQENIELEKLLLLCKKKFKYLNKLIPAFAEYVEDQKPTVILMPNNKDNAEKSQYNRTF